MGGRGDPSTARGRGGQIFLSRNVVKRAFSADTRGSGKEGGLRTVICDNDYFQARVTRVRLVVQNERFNFSLPLSFFFFFPSFKKDIQRLTGGPFTVGKQRPVSVFICSRRYFPVGPSPPLPPPSALTPRRGGAPAVRLFLFPASRARARVCWSRGPGAYELHRNIRARTKRPALVDSQVN